MQRRSSTISSLIKCIQKREGSCPCFAAFDVWAQWELSNEIEENNKKLHDLPQRILNPCDLGEERSSKGGSLQERRQTSPLLKDSEVVGMKNDMQTLVAQLTRDKSLLQVVSIVGMAGLGKTTLARKVYNNGTVKKHFDFYAWVCASQEYSINHLLQSILMQFGIFTIKESQMNDLKLQERLLEHLMETRCLLVLDDVWDCKAWDDFEPFMNANSGSRILLTTHHKAVTLYPHTIDYELQCLGKDESWKLLCMITFPEQGMRCPQNLEQIGKEIVAKCHGLPLAIVVTGGLLSGRKRHVCEWQNVLRSISSQFVKRNPKIEEILALSYKDLPYHLRLCFLYFGIFPERHEFNAEKLMRLWVTEGFISPIQCETMEKTMEEVAEDYLDELIR